MSRVRRLSGVFSEMRPAQVVLELALLVLGILIALAVNSWMDDRRSLRLERQYLERLLQDIDRSVAIVRDFVEFEDRQVASGILAYRGLRGADPVDPEVLSTAISHLANRRTLWVVRATYQDLLGTGNLRLVRSPEVRDAIVNLYHEADRIVAVVNVNNQMLVDEAFASKLADSGLVATRLVTNNAMHDPALEELVRRLGVPVDTSHDRLWALAEDAPERVKLTNSILRRTMVSVRQASHGRLLQGHAEDTRAAIAAALAD